MLSGESQAMICPSESRRPGRVEQPRGLVDEIVPDDAAIVGIAAVAQVVGRRAQAEGDSAVAVDDGVAVHGHVGRVIPVRMAGFQVTLVGIRRVQILNEVVREISQLLPSWMSIPLV